jgi:hypothetical protein
MLQLDLETADIIAARGVQRALAFYPGYLSETVELTVVALLAADKIDMQVASYVIHNSDRFTLMPPPLYLDAKWHVEADVIANSAHPFGTAQSS